MLLCVAMRCRFLEFRIELIQASMLCRFGSMFFGFTLNALFVCVDSMRA